MQGSVLLPSTYQRTCQRTKHIQKNNLAWEVDIDFMIFSCVFPSGHMNVLSEYVRISSLTYSVTFVEYQHLQNYIAKT